MTRPPRILILRGGAIGDFIFTLPVLQALRRQWPAAYIELIGYPHITRLAEAAGLADRLRGLDTAGIARFFGLRPQIDDETRRHLASFDFVISFLHDPDGVVRDNLLAHGVRRLLYRSPVGPAGHIVDHLVQPLESLALYEAGAVPALRLKPEFLEQGRTRLDQLGVRTPPVAIHCGSGSPRKNWPLNRFADVARAIAAERPLVFVIGEADHAIAPSIRELARETEGRLLEGLDLLSLAGVLSHCAAFLGNDSGVTHIAAALGRPVVALFGPTDPTVWGPRGAQVRIVRSPTERMDDLPPGQVLQALRELLAAAER
ncbi:MAG: glycosyltransferase family 9 protein [Kiritimatiellae bacterium]|nr:glycosyltransferase family 9 protein [Kiritimatiellia bacterium]